MASNNPYSDIGAEPVEDYSDLGAVAVGEPAPQAADFSDLGAEPVKDVNFFEGIRDFALGIKKKVSDAFQMKQAEAQAKEAADNDPTNWSSSRFRKDFPKPKNAEEQAIYDITLEKKKQNEEAIKEEISPTPPEPPKPLTWKDIRGDWVDKTLGILQDSMKDASNPDSLKAKIIKNPNFIEDIQNHFAQIHNLTLEGAEALTNGISQVYERTLMAPARAMAKETPLASDLIEKNFLLTNTRQSFVHGFLNPEKYPPGTFPEAIISAANSEAAPKWIKELGDPLIAGTMGFLADSGSFFGVPEAMGRIVTGGKVSLLKKTLDNINSEIYARGLEKEHGVYAIDGVELEKMAKDRDVLKVTKDYLKSRNIKIKPIPAEEVKPPLLEKVKGETVTPEVIKEVGAVPVEESPSVISYVRNGEKLYTSISPDEYSVLKDEVANIPSAKGGEQIHLDANTSSLQKIGREVPRDEFIQGHPQAAQVFEAVKPTPEQIEVYKQKAEEVNADAEREVRLGEKVTGALTPSEKEAFGVSQKSMEPSLFEEAKRQVLADARGGSFLKGTGEGDVQRGIKPPSGTGFPAMSTDLPQAKILPEDKLAELPPTLGGMEYVRALEMPELVKMAKDISDNFPSVVKKTGNALGRFVGRPGEKGSIKLVASIFKDPELAAGVLAHEIGHNIDWLPEGTLSRGNLIGRAISSVNKFMKHKFGDLNVKELRKELEGLTTFWHPFTPDDSSYTKYRFSSKELYAEFLSVLLNAPGKAQELAHKFYDAFFEHLDAAKPDVKQSFFDIQALLSKPEELLKSREEDITNMFQKSRDEFQNILSQKEASKKSLRFLLKYHFIDRNAAILEAREKVKTPVNPEEDPKYLLEENSMIGGFIKSHLDNFDPIYHELEAKGLDFDKDFGQYIFLKRVSADRAELANPLGHNPETAGRQLDALKERLGEEKFKALEESVTKAREWFSGINDLLKEDILTPDQIKTVEGNNDYAPFRVTKYLKEYASAKFAQQVGTLNEIENPGASMVLKGVAMLRLYKRNLIEKNTMKFLLDSGDAQPATVQIYDKNLHIPEKEGMEVVKWREKGKWQAAHVDPFIADSFKYDDSGQLQTIGEVFNKLLLNNDIFRPLYITYNVGFQSFNLIKDFARFWKNTPGLSFPQAIKNYGKAVPHAVARAKGDFDPVIQKMEQEGALNITMNDMMMGKDTEDTEIDALMAKYGLRQEEKKINPLVYPLKKLMDGIKFTGDVIETIPKVAGFYALEDTPAAERAYRIRNAIGTPNFKRKGKMFPIYNSVFMFSNIFKEGLRSDYEVAFRDPKTRSGYWWKTTKQAILPKILMALGAAGLFGKAIQDNYEKQTEYDKTNYVTIPLGEDDRGKAVYARIPLDETGRLISGLFWKTISRKEPQDILAFTGGQLPSMSPTLNILSTWGEFLTGGNPRDNYRNQEILTRNEAQAGGMRALEPMIRWTVNQSGMVHMDIRDRLKDETLTEKTLALTPIVNRFIRMTDYGKQEKLHDVIEETQAKEANQRLDKEDKILSDIKSGKTAAQSAKDIPYKERAKYIQKYVRTKEKPNQSPEERALGQAVSNEEKLQVLDEISNQYKSVSDFRKALVPYYRSKTISLPVLNKAVRAFNQKKGKTNA